MKNAKKNIWAWLQSGNRIYKVISDKIKGTIEVYDNKGNLVMKKKNLSQKAIKVIEENFLNINAKKLNEGPIEKSKTNDFDPMVA